MGLAPAGRDFFGHRPGHRIFPEGSINRDLAAGRPYIFCRKQFIFSTACPTCHFERSAAESRNLRSSVTAKRGFGAKIPPRAFGLVGMTEMGCLRQLQFHPAVFPPICHSEEGRSPDVGIAGTNT